MSTEDAGHDDAFNYADAMACALAAVVLLLFTALVQIGAGKETTDAFAILTLELIFDKSIQDQGVAGKVLFQSAPFAVFQRDGRFILNPDASARGFQAKPEQARLRKDRLVVETPPDQMPAISFNVEPWPDHASQSTGGGFLWTTRLMIRWPAAPESFDWEWLFDNSGQVPYAVKAILRDHTMTNDGRWIEKEKKDDGGLPHFRVQVEEGSIVLEKLP